jgi:phosphoribosylamine--glycine ligase
MGAYAPAPSITPGISEQIKERIFDPLLKGLKQSGTTYRGVIYAGIMLTDDGPSVLEFNCRFGDPETQVILPLMLGDLGELLLACADGKLGDLKAKWLDRSALCVVAASGGYPGKYEKGYPITGQLTGKGNWVVFHAGTTMIDGQLATNGGRVLGVTGVAADLRQAYDRAYEAIKGIEFEGMQYRQDIGFRGLERLRL